VVVLSKVGRSETQFTKAVEAIEEAGFELLRRTLARRRDGFQSDLDFGPAPAARRATLTYARSPSGWRRRSGRAR